MSRPGFFISRLVITGPGLADAELAFVKGTNVITGPSDTGKSYIVECIEYMLGSDEPPGTDIEEARGYDLAFVELTSYGGEVVTLERALAGGDVNLYRAKYDERATVETTPLAVETQTRSRETLSNFILSLFGAKGMEVRTNATGSKANLTFRTISHFILVDESRIIAKASPIRLANGFAKTSSERAFNYLITGHDDHAIIPMQQKPTERKAALAGKREAFDELIARLESRLKDTNLEELRKKATTLDEQISGKLEQLETSAESIQELQTTRQSAFNLVETSNARLETIVELLARFAILKDHYLSDLKRLDFLQETDHYFDQLTAVKCPLCGTLLEAHAAQKMCVDATTNVPDMQQACAAEAAKIRNLLKDLEQTIGGLESERKEVTAKSQEQRAELGRLEQSLSQELRPVFVATKKELEELSAERQELNSVESSFQTLEQYRRSRSELDAPEAEATQQFEGLSPVAARQFANAVQSLLQEWRFISDKSIVELNESKMDLTINGKPRQSHGKGIRAFIHTSFNIGLMHYCRQNDLPHPGTTIIDSPLTSYREGKKHEAEDETSPEIQTAFWESLSQWTTAEQIIVIENKEPTETARSGMNYIRFVGANSTEAGRKGSFPLNNRGNP